MKSVLCVWVGFVIIAVRGMAAEPAGALIAAVTAADEARIAAMVTGDRPRLEKVFSDELRYAHSNGKLDTKASLIDAVVSHRTVYERFDYQERNFMPAGPGVVLMNGRVIVHVGAGAQAMTLDLNFLAVWREEHGRWRFLAWQSSRNPAPPGK